MGILGHPDTLDYGFILRVLAAAPPLFRQSQRNRSVRRLLEKALEKEIHIPSWVSSSRVPDGDLRHAEGIASSMTPEERKRPEIIGGSRARRIASGSGTTLLDVIQLLRQPRLDRANYREVSQTTSDAERLSSVSELTLLYYVSGDGQEAAPGEMAPRQLRVGAANGRWPVAGAQVRYRVDQGDGTLHAAGDSGDELRVRTDPNGMAQCAWQLDSVNQSQRVEATLLNADGDPVQSPLHFEANLASPVGVVLEPTDELVLERLEAVEKEIARLGGLVGQQERGGQSAGQGTLGTCDEPLIDIGGSRRRPWRWGSGEYAGRGCKLCGPIRSTWLGSQLPPLGS